MNTKPPVTNGITQFAELTDPTFSFAGAATVSAVGGQSEKTRMSALAMCSDLSGHSLNAAKAVGVVLAAGAVGGCMDAASAGAAAMMAVTASILGGNGSKGPVRG